MKNKYRALAAAVCLTAPMLSQAALRVNQAGYLTDDLKSAVYLGDINPSDLVFSISGLDGVAGVDSVVTGAAWEPAAHSARIWFSSLTAPGDYVLAMKDRNGSVLDVIRFYVGDDAYSHNGLFEMPLNYIRQQRCGYNPVLGTTCHTHDGFVVESDSIDGRHYDVTGGWHDASDYLQYLTTSANSVYQMLFAYDSNPTVWTDSHDARGDKNANGVADILDEARWGLEWMMKMNPEEGIYFNQIADDRDHKYAGLPAQDSVDYGRGPGLDRPVYTCSNHPTGLMKYKNRSRGLASSVGKFASSFALGAKVFAKIDSAFAAELGRRAEAAYAIAKANPGPCQTAPGSSPYFYEEDNWTDDLELAAISLYGKNGDKKYLADAVDYGRMEPVTPWMGADSARHYQWYPFVNLGHARIAELADGKTRDEFVRNLRSGLERVTERGSSNIFNYGIPFIWCSNNLGVAFVTQAMLYRELTGDNRYLAAETAARDWLFGLNPWGQTMIIVPEDVTESSPADPHAALSNTSLHGKAGRHALIGGLVDGPVYTAIFNKLWGVTLRRDDAFKDFQNSTVVYHDDYSDYSTNEPTLDGTASLTYMLGRLAAKGSKK